MEESYELLDEQKQRSDYDMSYYSHCRNEILDHIPADVESVLSVGCGSGITESELVKRGIKVVGIELNPDAAEEAKLRGLTILNGDAMDVRIDEIEGLFSCLIYADVLEHVIDPAAILERHVKFLKEDGWVIVSVPNFRHYSVFQRLFLRGCINYTDAGILDRSHLRITTRKMVLNWFKQAGLQCQTYEYLMGPKRKMFSFLTGGIFQEFLAKQVILIGRKRCIQSLEE